MRIYLILGCVVASFSFLIGAYVGSWGLGTIVFFAIISFMYGVYKYLFDTLVFSWTVAILGGFTTLLWMTYIDQLLGTTFIAVFFSIVVGAACFFLTSAFFKKHRP